MLKMENIKFYNFDPEKIKIANILHIGRSSSIFFQGLLEGHPEIITIVGHFYPEERDIKLKNLEIITENIYKKLRIYIQPYIKSLDIENKIPKKEFKKYLLEYLKTFGVSTKTLLIGIYYSYAKISDRDLSKIRYILLGSHDLITFLRSLKDFKDQKIFFTTRDPRANYLSYKKKGYLLFGLGFTYNHYLFLKRLIKNKFKVFVVKHEILHKDYKILKKEIISFLKIKYSKEIESCTFFNLPYDGSEWKSSTRGLTSIIPNKKFVEENWKFELTSYELIFIQFIFSDMMKYFDYKKESPYKNIYIRTLGNDFRNLSIENIKKYQGINKLILEFCRKIYFIPLLGLFIIKVVFLSYHCYQIIKIYFKTKFKKI